MGANTTQSHFLRCPNGRFFRVSCSPFGSRTQLYSAQNPYSGYPRLATLSAHKTCHHALRNALSNHAEMKENQNSERTTDMEISCAMNKVSKGSKGSADPIGRKLNVR